MLVVDVLPQDGVVLLVQADRVRDRVRLPAGVVEHGVDVPDLAEAVAAQLQRGGHEPQTPLADVEGGPPVVVEGRVAVGHHHLRERHPVGDVAHGAVVVVRHLVDHRTLAVVEAQPHRPVLPAQLGALEGEGRALGLGDLQRPEVGAQVARPGSGHVLRVHRRLTVVVVVLELEQLQAVQVDHQLEARHRVRVDVARRRLPVPDVAPAQPAVPPLLGHQRATVGPHLDHHQRQVGDPAGRERGDHLRMGPHRLVDLVVSSTVKFGVTPGRCDQDDHPRRPGRPPPPRPGWSARSHSTARETRGTGSPVRHAFTAALAGSSSAIEANRHVSPSPRSSRSSAAVRRNSSSDSGSSGCCAITYPPLGSGR